MKTMRILSMVLEWFVGLSAIAGGYVVATTNGKGFDLSPDWLNGSFDSYLIPGIILAVVVGGTGVLAAAMEMMKSKRAHEATAIANFGLLIWLFTELYILDHTNWLQILYFGIAIITLIFLLFRIKYEKAAVEPI